MFPNIVTGLERINLSSVPIALLVLCFSFLIILQRRKGKLPPGPKALPFLGNLHQLDTKYLVKSLQELSNKYGPVFTIYLGPQPNVVLFGYKAVKEALVEQADNFSGRGDFPAVYRFTQGNGIAFSNGEKWKVLRRFALVTLRNFGMGKRSVEERIQEEAQFMLEEFRNTKQKPFDPTFFLSRAVSNVICSIVFGDRFQYEDKRFLSLLQFINDNFQVISSGWGKLYNIFPGIMNHLPGPHNRIFKNFENIKSFLLEIVKDHENTLQPECPRDFIDCFLIKMQKEKGNPMSSFNTETLVMTTHNLFFGGTETVSTTLRYGILILMKYPEITEKVHQEIDKVIGRNRCPAVEDRSKMPYTDAVIHEIQRFTSVIPLSLPHCVIQDTQFRGYHLPKGTNVIPVLTSVHNDPEKFKEPEVFNPDNFLDENNRFKNNDAFMPFSTGKRICLGEGLARMELFIFFTTFLQNLNFKPTVHPDEIDLTPSVSGVGNIPATYQLIAVPR
ncbi:cytochrome P450 2F2-like [Hyla sarda]|uniref:cytochrome P450 2F2-like n=1 Tax=Hyla sarda TaxID=327740 RepID=UPI0024C3BD30|nr:cytochrome P450 2F2-like [Hyla sarda]XP_056393973.1 cytochrome P450 2F2-like [Hyla sarda]XP_056393974.1 cytochrome P450 2F2-like [Hyla sarda]